MKTILTALCTAALIITTSAQADMIMGLSEHGPGGPFTTQYNNKYAGYVYTTYDTDETVLVISSRIMDPDGYCRHKGTIKVSPRVKTGDWTSDHDHNESRPTIDMLIEYINGQKNEYCSQSATIMNVEPAGLYKIDTITPEAGNQWATYNTGFVYFRQVNPQIKSGGEYLTLEGTSMYTQVELTSEIVHCSIVYKDAADHTNILLKGDGYSYSYDGTSYCWGYQTIADVLLADGISKSVNGIVVETEIILGGVDDSETVFILTEDGATEITPVDGQIKLETEVSL